MSAPQNPVQDPGREPHRYQQAAESFGADAGRYDRTRPAYPDLLVQRIIAASPGPRMLDVGCGTGIETRQFQAAGCSVLGVEPDARMAGFAQTTGVGVEVATFEAWDPAGRKFDAVIAGTAWHWVDPEAVAVRLGAHLHQGRVAGPDAHAAHSQSFPAGPAGRGAPGRGYRDRRDRGQLHDAVHHRGGHRDANQRPMTGTGTQEASRP
jgi:SAM-dependent methyltransferase